MARKSSAKTSRSRSAITGEYVSAAEAKKHPKTTVTERGPHRKKKKK